MNAHRTLLPNTGTKARTPAELPPTNQPARYDKRKAKPLPNGSLPPWGRVGVGAASHPRSNKNNVELSPSLLDSQSATRPAFTYTFPAILYVNVGWGLPHRADATAGTKAQNLAVLLPPLVGESRGGVHPHTALPDSQPATRHAVTVRQGAPYRADVLNMAAGGLPSTLKPLTPPRRSRTSRELFQSPTGGGGVLIANGRAVAESCERHSRYDSRNAKPSPICPLPCRAKPAAGEGWGGGNARHVITNATSSSALLPPPVGLEQLARSATSICSRSERKGRGGVHPHTALPDSQSATRHAVTVRQGAPYSTDVLNMATDELPSALKPLTPPQPSPTGGGSLPVEGRDSGSSINAHNAATIATIPADLPLPCRAKPAAGEGWGEGNARHVITNATSSSALPPPPWGRVGGSPRKMRLHFSWEPGVGAAHDPRSDKFTYTFPATLYVNVGWGLPHRADATAGTTVRTLAVLPPPPVGEGWGGGSKPFAQRQYLTLPKSPFVTRHAVTVRQGAPCRALPVRESRGGVRPHTALPNRQSAPCPAFTYTFPAILYVKGATCHAMP